MAPLFFAVLWVISVSLLRICPELSWEQHNGGVGFQTKNEVKDVHGQKKKVMLECRYSKIMKTF